MASHTLCRTTSQWHPVAYTRGIDSARLHTRLEPLAVCSSRTQYYREGIKHYGSSCMPRMRMRLPEHGHGLAQNAHNCMRCTLLHTMRTYTHIACSCILCRLQCRHGWMPCAGCGKCMYRLRSSTLLTYTDGHASACVRWIDALDVRHTAAAMTFNVRAIVSSAARADGSVPRHLFRVYTLLEASKGDDMVWVLPNRSLCSACLVIFMMICDESSLESPAMRCDGDASIVDVLSVLRWHASGRNER